MDIIEILMWTWLIIAVIQSYLNFRTVRWILETGTQRERGFWKQVLVLCWSSIIPGLGFYFWYKNREIDE